MAEFGTPLVEITKIGAHPNADRLDITHVFGYTCIVQKGSFKVGDKAVYLQEGALIPQWLLGKMGLWKKGEEKGMLAGSQGNRVKAIRLRGIFSQGLLYPVRELDASAFPAQVAIETYGGEAIAMLNADPSGIAEALGITKYIPKVPTHFDGSVLGVSDGTLKFDIEDLQRHPGAILDGEHVVVTEKIHGSWTCFGFVPWLNDERLLEGGTIVTSKGLSSKGMVFDTSEGQNVNNLYVRMWRKLMETTGTWERIVDEAKDKGEAIYILGETFGAGVQDLHYGMKDPEFRVFAILRKGEKEHAANYLDYGSLMNYSSWFGLETVPLLWFGSFSREKVEKHRDGKTTFDASHVREGIVISLAGKRKTSDEHPFIKLVSPKYLLRKGEATEFE